LIHAAVWPQQTWAKQWWAAVPFFGGRMEESSVPI